MSTEDRGWTDDPDELLRYRVLDVMGTGETDIVEIASALTSGPQEVGWVIEYLVTQGLAKPFSSRAGDTFPDAAVLTPEGRKRIASMRAARTPGERKRRCTSAMLAWLDANDGVALMTTEQFHDDVRAHLYGEPFAAQAGWQSARDLKARGLISGTGTGQGPVLRPAITPIGRAVHSRYDGDLGAWQAEASHGGTTINVTGSTGVTVAHNSPGARQTAHVSTDVREQVLNLAAALEQMSQDTSLLGLDPADVARAAGLVDELRVAAETVESEPGKVRRLVSVVKEIAVQGTGSAAGTALVALAEAVAQNL